MLWYTLLVLLVALLIMAPAAALASLASHTAEQRRQIEEQELLQRQAEHDLLRRQLQLHVHSQDVHGQARPRERASEWEGA